MNLLNVVKQSRRILSFLMSFMVLLSCNSNKKEQAEAQFTKTVITKNANKKHHISIEEGYGNISTMLSELIQNCGYLKMPFIYDYNTGASSSLPCDDFIATDRYEKLRQQLGCDVIFGVVPETKEYTAVLVGLAASMMNVELLTIDSTGLLIDRKSIMHNHCIHYVEEDLYCFEKVMLSDSLAISYRYESKYITYDIEEKADTACDIMLQFGTVLGNGIIELKEFEESACE